MKVILSDNTNIPKFRAHASRIMAPGLQWTQIRIKDHLTLLAWKRQLRAILLIEGTWAVVSGELKRPYPVTDDNFARCKEWKEMAEVALGWMLLTMDDYTRQSCDVFNEPVGLAAYLFGRFPPKFMTFDEFVGGEVGGSSESGDGGSLSDRGKQPGRW